MEKVLSRLFGFLKFILLVIAFGLTFYGIMVTYARLEKPLTDAVPVFLPFAFVLVMFFVSMFIGSKNVKDNLLFNFVSVAVFLITIIICLRSMFDTNMILFKRYGINYNPTFLTDNLSAIKAMLYMLGASNILLLICDILEKGKKNKVVASSNEEIDK